MIFRLAGTGYCYEGHQIWVLDTGYCTDFTNFGYWILDTVLIWPARKVGRGGTLLQGSLFLDSTDSRDLS